MHATGMQVSSLVAQSLDLPPQAARWRHQQRSPAPGAGVQSVYSLPSTASVSSEKDEGEVRQFNTPKSANGSAGVPLPAVIGVPLLFV